MKTHYSNSEQEILHQKDQKVVSDAIAWLSTFWWANRKPVTNSDYVRDKEQATWETDRAIQALLNLKNNPSK